MTAAATRERIRVADVALAAVLVVVGLMGTGPASQHQPGVLPPDVWAYGLVVTASAAVVAWRRYPLPVFVVTGACVVAYIALGHAFGPIVFPVALAMAGLAARRPLRLALAAAAIDLAAIAAALAVRAERVGSMGPVDAATGLALAGGVWLGLPLAVGAVIRIRREATARVRSEQARRAVSEERLRMAQELHDVVGHGLAVIAMQAGVGLHVLDRDPAKAREALEAIRGTSREALEGLRHELQALRGGRPGSEAGPRRPADGLADLPVLVGRVRSGGVQVELRTEVDDAQVSAETELAAYRIVQEALTNVLRHAGPSVTARVLVRVAHARDLVVEVIDDGAGGAEPVVEPGGGLVNMRERAERLGGEVQAGPQPGGGFAVRARLPLVAPAGTAGVPA